MIRSILDFKGVNNASVVGLLIIGLLWGVFISEGVSFGFSTDRIEQLENENIMLKSQLYANTYGSPNFYNLNQEFKLDNSNLTSQNEYLSLILNVLIIASLALSVILIYLIRK